MINYTVNTCDAAAMARAKQKWDAVAKPLNSLGKLETIVSQLAGIAGSEDVTVFPRAVLVCCADHGVVARGVTQSGQEVTALVARSVAQGTANVNLMARVARADVIAVDAGMATPVDEEGLIDLSCARGTRDMTTGPAMTREEAEKTVQAGIDLVGDMAQRGYRMIATGEMGIGNTTATTALCCALLGMTPDVAVGRGAGLSDEGLKRKRDAVRRALVINRPKSDDVIDSLHKVGGYEIAMMAGIFLGGMTHRVPILIDGAISAVSALIAFRLCPQARDFMIPSHMSREPAAWRVMEALGFDPVLHADMALGEGTGAVALMPLIDMALNVYSGTHTFEDLGMAAYTPQGGGK